MNDPSPTRTESRWVTKFSREGERRFFFYLTLAFIGIWATKELW